MGEPLNSTTSTNFGDIANITASALNDTITGKTPVPLHGTITAYGGLFLMALFPVFYGSLRSVEYHKISMRNEKETGKAADKMSQGDALMFPLYASMALCIMYMMFKIFAVEDINLIFTCYFYVMGIFAISHTFCPVFEKSNFKIWPVVKYNLKFSETKFGSKKNFWINYSFTSYDCVICMISVILATWYFVKRNWIANNILGVAFSINGIEVLLLNNVRTACILLGGLFVYDVFWVFYTDVMVTVAKSFEVPIKLLFPQDIFENGILDGKNFAMLGLGDIVIPGIYVALLLRFDCSLKRQSRVYFYTGFVSYILGLALTIFVLHLFKVAQPALLYLVPLCVLNPCFMAFCKGDYKALFAYEDHPEIIEDEKKLSKRKDKGGKVEKEIKDKNAAVAIPKKKHGGKKATKGK